MKEAVGAAHGAGVFIALAPLPAPDLPPRHCSPHLTQPALTF
jgi:hypothetical protein